MKRFLLALGAASMFSPAIAQHKHGQEYDKSVFKNRLQVRNNAAIKKTNDAAHAAFPNWSINVDKANGTIRDIYGPAITLPGTTNLQRAQNCMSEQMSGLGVNPSEWVMYRDFKTDKAGWVDYSQVINGHKVIFSRLGFRFSPDGRMMRVQMKNYGNPQNYTAPTISSADALTASMQDLTGATVSSSSVGTDWVWFPVPSATGYELHPAWAFNINGTDLNKEEMQLRGYVDATNGEVVYRTNDVKFDYDLTVKAMVYVNGTTQAATLEPLANLKLTVNGGGPYLTDNLGFYSNLGLTIPDLTTITLEGRWSKVRDVPTNNTVPSMQENITALGSTYTYPTTGLAQSRHINAYYHVNRVHDYMKGHYPTFVGMDITLPTNVDLTTNVCNAFYNGSSINFYAAGSGCNSFAEIGDIVYHEYGHGINDKFYVAQLAPSMDNGALNEGYADVWAMSITDNPILGQNSTVGGYIRRYDQAPKVYPDDIEGEVHADGEIIAGAWWDLKENLNNVDTMANIFAQSLYETPDGPNGTEGEVFHAALISALVADDDDANINNGTPHFYEIVTAFSEHQIYLLSDAEVIHTDIENQYENNAIPITATVNITYQPFLKDVLLMYKVRPSTTYTSITMTHQGGNVYTAQIPAQTGTQIVDYYMAIRDTLSQVNAYGPTGFSATSISNKSNIPYQFGVQLLCQTYEYFEDVLTGWTIGNFAGLGTNSADNATAGKWIQAVPVPSSVNGLMSQTGQDASPLTTGKCLVTGNATSSTAGVGSADVDGGRTSVLTPIIDITGFENPIIEYYRWYSNNRGSNPGTEKWEVKIGVPTATFWPTIESTYVPDQSWRRRIFKVRDHVATGNQIQMLFIANDATDNGGCVVEAAIDNLLIYDRFWPSSVPGNELVERANIYPNPANETVNITLPSYNITNGTIGIYDMSGKNVQEIALQKDKKEYQLNTKSIAAGTYFLMIKAEKMIQSQKITVAH